MNINLLRPNQLTELQVISGAVADRFSEGVVKHASPVLALRF